MPKLEIVNANNVINSFPQKANFKLKNTGGPKGERGYRGEPGQDATIEVVSTTTGEPGTNASVVNQGTPSAAQLAFTIPRGNKGETGAAGYSPTATVSKTGDTATITITDKNGTTAASIKDGKDGAAGAPGAAATITVGSTTTGNPGTNASVTNSGTSSAAVLDFVIPKGAKGDTGSTGSAATITVGSTTTGQPGGDASVTNSGTTSAAVLDFVIPRGEAGADGADGEAATITVGSTTTGQAGTNASVTNSGTSSAAVLDFVIPRGETGSAGSAATVTVGTVTTGQPGTDAIVTNSGTTSAAVFNFTIPRGDKGEAGSGAGDMLASDYDPNGTVQNAGGIPDYVSSVLPTKTSELTNDGSDGTSTYVEADELATVATTGSYADLSNTPTIPTVNNATLTITQNGTSAGTFTANSSTDATIALTDTTYSAFTGATSSVAGSSGLVPAPATADVDKYLKGDGTWGTVVSGGLVEMAYGESNAWQKFIDAYTAKKIVYCRASSNANPGTGTKTRKAFMAYVNDENSPTTVEFQYVRSVGTKSASQQCDQVFVYKLTNASGGTWSVETRDMASKVVAGTNMSSSYSSGTLTLSTDNMTGATSSANGTAGCVPAPTTSDVNKVLSGAGTWIDVSGGSSATVFYLNTDLSSTSSVSFYKDSGKTTTATVDDIATAALDGGAELKYVGTATYTQYKVLTVSGPNISSGTRNFQVSGENMVVCAVLSGSVGATSATVYRRTIPTVNDATLTIQKNGTSVGTFTANASSNSTVNITTLTAEEIADPSTITPVATAKAVTLKNENGDTIYPVTDASLVNNIEKDVMTITGNYTDTQFYNEVVQLNTLLGSSGSKLTFASSSYGIKIGAGVSKILVSASIFFSNGTMGYGWLKLYKNGSSTGIEAIAYTTTNSFGTATLCPVVMNVQENDVITLFSPETVRIRGTSSFLTVEVIA